jgi:hypothetical protein
MTLIGAERSEVDGTVGHQSGYQRSPTGGADHSPKPKLAEQSDGKFIELHITSSGYMLDETACRHTSVANDLTLV